MSISKKGEDKNVDFNKQTPTQVKSNIAVRMNSNFPITRTAPKKGKKGGKKSAGKMATLNVGRELRSLI